MTESDESRLISLALSEGDIESTENKNMIDKFAEDINLKPGQMRISLKLLHDYYQWNYNSNVLIRIFSITIKKYVSLAQTHQNIVCLIDPLCLKVSIDEMKTAIVKAVYDSRKKKRTETSKSKEDV